jgi:hypothetical protein
MDAHYYSFHVGIEGRIKEGQLGGFSGEEEGFGLAEGERRKPEGKTLFTTVEDIAGVHCCLFCGENELPEATDALGYEGCDGCFDFDLVKTARGGEDSHGSRADVGEEDDPPGGFATAQGLDGAWSKGGCGSSSGNSSGSSSSGSSSSGSSRSSSCCSAWMEWYFQVTDK